MATSGVYRYNVTANDILEETFGLIGVYAPGEALDASEVTDALRTLNMMLKTWQAEHIGLWLNKELVLFLEKSEYKYNIGPTGDHCANAFAKTEVATAAASGASSLIIDAVTNFSDTYDRNGIITATTPTGAGSITLTGALVSSGIATLPGNRKILIYSVADESGVVFGITGQDADGIAVTENITGPNTTTVYSTYEYKTITAITIDGAGTGNIEVGCVGDAIGIELDDGTLQWTNIGAALSTTTTLITTLTDSVAVDNHVYSYTVKVPRPLEIIETRLHDSSDRERPLKLISRNEYMNLANKTTTGQANQIYYDSQTIEGIMNIWPACSNVKDYIKFTARLPIQNLEAITNDFEISAEWFEPIAWNLAVRMFPKYEKAIAPGVALMAADMKETAKGFDREYQSIFINMVTR